jgi:hypothetical protein
MAKTTANRVAEAMLKALARIETVDGFTAHSPRDIYCMGFMLGILHGAERVFELPEISGTGSISLPSFHLLARLRAETLDAQLELPLPP